MYNANKETIILQNYVTNCIKQTQNAAFQLSFNSKNEQEDYRFVCSNYCLENVNLMFSFLTQYKASHGNREIKLKRYQVTRSYMATIH
jgi:hypothetical protein